MTDLSCVFETSALKRIVRPNVGIPRTTLEIRRWIEASGLSIIPVDIMSDVDDFIFPNGAHCSYSSRLEIGIKTGADVLTVHDCREIEHPELSPHSPDVLRNRIHSHWSRGGIIHTFTNTVANVIRELIGSTGKLSVARLDPVISSGSLEYSDALVHRDARPRIVVVGTEALHKGHSFLLDCWSRLPACDAELVIVGPRGSASTVIDSHPAINDPTVMRLGNLPENEKLAVMKTACAVVAPSMHEGLGLVPIEALQLGVPLIASDIAAHREVACALAEYVPVGSTGLIDLMRSAINGELVRPNNFVPRRDDKEWRNMFRLDSI